jgi:hypothetical protein
MIKFHRTTDTHTCKTGEILISYEDGTKVNFLVLIIYCLGEKLGEMFIRHPIYVFKNFV